MRRGRRRLFPEGRQRLIVRLTARRGVRPNGHRETSVDPVHHRGHRAKVLPDGQHFSPATLYKPLDVVVHGYVGAPEAIDGLLWVADDEQLAGLERDVPPVGGVGTIFSQEQDDLGLQRIRVLELVDEQIVEGLLPAFAQREVVAQSATQTAQKIGKVEIAAHELLASGPVRKLPGRRQDGAGHSVAVVGQDLRLRVSYWGAVVLEV